MALLGMFSAFKPPRALLGLLEAAANKAIEADPDIIPKIIKLDKKVVSLHIQGIDLNCFVVINNSQLIFLDSYAGYADVTISAPPFALASMALSGKPHQGVHFTGDTHTAQRFQGLLQSLDIDFEEILSGSIGDIAARQVGLLSKQVSSWLSRSGESLNIATRDYLQEEAAYIPTKIETTNFSNDVDNLRMDIDRLEARVNAIKRNKQY